MNRFCLLVLAVALGGCSNPAAADREQLPPSDPYMQALYAMMNYGACKFVRRDPQLSPHQQARLNQAISRVEKELAEVEALARSNGRGEYIDLGQLTFKRRSASELHIGCSPTEGKAMLRAEQSIELFRRHILALGSKRS